MATQKPGNTHGNQGQPDQAQHDKQGAQQQGQHGSGRDSIGSGQKSSAGQQQGQGGQSQADIRGGTSPATQDQTQHQDHNEGGASGRDAHGRQQHSIGQGMSQRAGQDGANPSSQSAKSGSPSSSRSAMSRDDEGAQHSIGDAYEKGREPGRQSPGQGTDAGIGRSQTPGRTAGTQKTPSEVRPNQGALKGGALDAGDEVGGGEMGSDAGDNTSDTTKPQ